MTATQTLDQLSPEQREKFMAKSDRLLPDGKGGLKSPFFHIRPGIIGGGAYDRPLIIEKPSVIAVVWGLDKQGKARIGMIQQKRPPANDPLNPGDGHPPLIFAQTVMGYFSDGESIKDAALREKVEESGKSTVLNVEVPDFSHFNVEPNTFATWHHVVFVQVDLSTVDEFHADEEEYISGVQYLPVPELLQRIKRGQDEQGAHYRGSGTTLGPLMIFFAHHPELLR